MKTPYDKLLQSTEGRAALAEEHAIAHVTELMAKLLEENEMARSEFAQKLGVTTGEAIQLLDGDANMTLATIARVLNVFGYFFEGAARRADKFAAQPAATGFESLAKELRDMGLAVDFSNGGKMHVSNPAATAGDAGLREVEKELCHIENWAREYDLGTLGSTLGLGIFETVKRIRAALAVTPETQGRWISEDQPPPKGQEVMYRIVTVGPADYQENKTHGWFWWKFNPTITKEWMPIAQADATNPPDSRAGEMRE